MTANARHSKITNRWGTPDNERDPYVSMARQALGGYIELDPMSEPLFNRVVQAQRYYTEADDALTKSWACRTLFLNHAGGLTLESWRKLCSEYYLHRFKAIWVGFSVEQLNLLADEAVHPLDYSCLLTRDRIGFTRHDGYEGSPSHGNYVVGMGIHAVHFDAAFRGRGKIVHGPFAITGMKELLQTL